MLEPYPAWAVMEACLWWLSAANPQRQYPPVPGDIQARANDLMAPLRAAAIMCDLGPAVLPLPEPVRVPASAEARVRILAEAGYRFLPAIRRFGQEGGDDDGDAERAEPATGTGRRAARGASVATARGDARSVEATLSPANPADDEGRSLRDADGPTVAERAEQRDGETS